MEYINHSKIYTKLCETIHILVLCLICTQLQGQTVPKVSEVETGKKKHKHRDIAAFGFGLGQDYGGIGVNLTVYPQKSIGLFASLGYALGGTGYNVGLKFRSISEATFQSVSPFATFMYGYNASIKVTNNSELNKLFYGPTVGGGVDFRGRQNRGYFTIAILVPFRDEEVEEYMESLEKIYGVRFNSKLLPVTFSVGYRAVLY